MSLSEIQRFLNGFDSLYHAKEYKTQTLKDTEIKLKKNYSTRFIQYVQKAKNKNEKSTV